MDGAARNRIVALASAGILSILGGAAAHAAPVFARHPTPAQVAASVGRFGAEATVNALFDQHRWDYVSGKIAAGDGRWVALAPKLAAGTDAGTAEELPIDLAFALPLNAPAVLAAMDSAHDALTGADAVCGLPFIEGTIRDPAAYRRKAIDAVTKVADPGLAAKKAQCLAALAQAS